MVEWQTRHLATFIGASAFGGQEELMKAASEISLHPKEKKLEEKPVNPNAAARLMQAFGGRLTRG